MPLYDHRCQDCLHTFEDLFSLNVTTTIISCPSCGSNNTERLVSRASLSGLNKFDNEIIGTRPDVKKEIRLTLKRAEELGKMKDPKYRAMAESLMRKVDSEPPKRQWDYEKDGHPSLGDLG